MGSNLHGRTSSVNIFVFPNAKSRFSHDEAQIFYLSGDRPCFLETLLCVLVLFTYDVNKFSRVKAKIKARYIPVQFPLQTCS